MAKLLRDSWLMFKSQFNVSKRNPVWVFIGLFQPICYMLLFAPLLKNLAGSRVPAGQARTIFYAGADGDDGDLRRGFAGLASSVGCARDSSSVCVSRLSAALAMIFGSLAVDGLLFMIQIALLVVVGLLLGFRPCVGGMALLAVLLFITGMTMACFSYCAGAAGKR